MWRLQPSHKMDQETDELVIKEEVITLGGLEWGVGVYSVLSGMGANM